MNVLGSMYGAAVSWRRRWYARDPSRVRRLSRPVVSVGNLRAGGSGKTPVVAYLAQLLVARGERPAILTRGYGRPERSEAVTVVSDGSRLLAAFETSGDEPLMLARALPGVRVVVAADRYAAGRHAESALDASVHVLDDGFQHIALARDADLLLADAADLADRLLPAGRLREPLESARAADAVLVTARDERDVAHVASALGVETVFAVRRQIAPPLLLDGGPARLAERTPVFAFAGIARAERFFDDLGAAGYVLAGTTSFPDHHVYSQRDVDRIFERAAAGGATAVLTTEKDAERLRRLEIGPLPLAVVPLRATVEPETAFAEWLMGRLGRA